jgi:hypothetical protein
MPGPVELLGRRQARGARAHHRHPLAGPLFRRRGFGGDPALVEGPVDYRELYLLDGYGIVVDREHTSRLARGGAQHPRELREVVGSVQPVYRLTPAVPVDQVVPVRDQVPKGAADVAERHPAVHAARSLLPQVVLWHRLVDVTVVLYALDLVALRGGLAPDL